MKAVCLEQMVLGLYRQPEARFLDLAEADIPDGRGYVRTGSSEVFETS